MNVVLLLAHSIEEHDQVRLMHSLGHDVFSIGGYIEPRKPHDDKRPALDIDTIPELKAAVDALGQPHADVPKHMAPVPTGVSVGSCSDGHRDPMEAARRWLPDAILDWADVIICHHLEHSWLVPQWDRIKSKRVIWRTVGQSAMQNEWMMGPLRRDGLEIVRYSPKERNLPEFCGEDALIRFYKDPDEWTGWRGVSTEVINVTQDLYKRSLADDGQLQPPGYQWTSYQFWQAATKGLPRVPIGPGSETIGGEGPVTMDQMHDWLRFARAYLYTGTQPASYTLGLIEAMMSGIPVVSIGPEWHRILSIPGNLYGPKLFEGHEIAPLWSNDPLEARKMLTDLLNDFDYAAEISRRSRTIALDLFGLPRIAAQWQAYLTGSAVQQVERELVAA